MFLSHHWIAITRYTYSISKIGFCVGFVVSCIHDVSQCTPKGPGSSSGEVCITNSLRFLRYKYTALTNANNPIATPTTAPAMMGALDNEWELEDLEDVEEADDAELFFT